MRLRDLAGRRVVLWGAGRETAAVIRAAGRFDVRWNATVVDETAADGDDKLEGVDVIRGARALDVFDQTDVIVRSPGVSRHRPELAAAMSNGVTVTSGTNLWFAEHHGHITAVTGTKGKSTTASLIAHVLQALGHTVGLAGNIGRPPVDFLGEPEPERWVLEMSSFQASDLQRSPDVGVLTSLSPEHLDWHGSYENYLDDKLNLFAHNPDIVTVVNGGDAGASGVADRLPNVVFAEPDSFDVSTLQLAGRHNQQLAITALTAIAASGVSIDDNAGTVAEALSTFEPLPHRLHPIATVDGVTYIDDGLATTPVATLAALDAFSGREITVLVGGYDRGLSYEPLADAIVAGGRHTRAVTMPDNGVRIASLIRSRSSETTIEEAKGLDDAVEIAARITPEGGAVLLSPGAASFGHFRDYKDRSEAFARAVSRLG